MIREINLFEKKIPLVTAKETIVLGIHYMKVLRVRYDGHYREIEPHCLGINHKGTILLRAYQRYGGSVSNISPGWKLFNIRKFEYINVLPTEDFQTRALYHAEDMGMDRYIARIKHTSKEWYQIKKQKKLKQKLELMKETEKNPEIAREDKKENILTNRKKSKRWKVKRKPKDKKQKKK